MLQNGHNVMRFQLVTATLVAISVVPLKIVLLNAMGVSGAVSATIIPYMVFSALPTFIFSPQVVEVVEIVAHRHLLGRLG